MEQALPRRTEGGDTRADAPAEGPEPVFLDVAGFATLDGAALVGLRDPISQEGFLPLAQEPAPQGIAPGGRKAAHGAASIAPGAPCQVRDQPWTHVPAVALGQPQVAPQVLAVDRRFEGCRGGCGRRLLHRREGRLRRARTRLEEGGKGVVHLGREPGREVREEAMRRLRTNGPHEAFQRRWPREEPLPRAEVGLRALIQVLGGQAVWCTAREPRRHARPRRGIEGLDLEVRPKPLLWLYSGGFPVGWREAERGRQIALPSQVVEAADGAGHRMGAQASEEPQRTQWEGKAPAVVVAATSEALARLGF